MIARNDKDQVVTMLAVMGSCVCTRGLCRSFCLQKGF